MSVFTNNIIFETERLMVRQYTNGDLDRFFQLNGNEDVMRYIRPAQRIISDYEAWPGMGRWAMYKKDELRFIGSFAIIPIENSDKLQLGYALVKNDWGKGYATESVQGGIRYAFEKLGLNEIAGITYPQNELSQNVLLKNGFVFHKTFMEEDKELNMYLRKK
ncbi:MAG: GNAT family N-acetyltransferase [Bacteroidetes bacterium]|nr:MAG: GNAT family N-acetyltransferase [Bacteroidota bacterium]